MQKGVDELEHLMGESDPFSYRLFNISFGKITAEKLNQLEIALTRCLESIRALDSGEDQFITKAKLLTTELENEIKVTFGANHNNETPKEKSFRPPSTLVRSNRKRKVDEIEEIALSDQSTDKQPKNDSEKPKQQGLGQFLVNSGGHIEVVQPTLNSVPQFGVSLTSPNEIGVNHNSALDASPGENPSPLSFDLFDSQLGQYDDNTADLLNAQQAYSNNAAKPVGVIAATKQVSVSFEVIR